MELTVDQALQQGVAAHKEGKLQDAERLYRAILEAQPSHPNANHNLGALAVAVGKPLEAIPLFKLALEANPKIEQFWLSYIDALIKLERFDEAKPVLVEGKKSGVSSEKLDALNKRLRRGVLKDTNKTVKGQTLKEKRERLAEKKRSKTKKVQSDSSDVGPSGAQLDHLLKHYQAGRLEEAEALAVSLTQQFPSHPFAWKLLGTLLMQTGRLYQSLASLQKSVELLPRDAEAHSNLGVTLKKIGRLDEAQASYEKAIALKPNYAEAHYNLGITLKNLGRLDEAETCLRRALALKPDNAESHNNLGVILKEIGRLDEAEASYGKAIALKPDYAEAHSNLGNILQELGRLDKAETRLRRAIALNPDYAEAHNHLGITLKNLGRLNDAEASYERAIAVEPDHAAAHSNLGITLQELGRLEESEASFRKATSLKPDLAEAHRYLAVAKKFSRRDEQFLEMQALYRDPDISKNARCQICFALAKATDDLQDTEKAFQFYAEGNALRKKQLGYRRAQDKKLFEQLKAGYPRITAHGWKPDIVPSEPIPIFIVGMPRSGTTLVEQIISSHPLVTGAGELSFISQFGGSLAVGQTPAGKKAMSSFRKQYRCALEKRSEGNAIVTDKMPHNFHFLGLIAAALPEAKIIHVRRDPAAVCWANYTQYFVKESLGYCYDLDDILHYHQLYQDLMEYWHQAFPNRIYDLDYEGLTEHQEEETRKLIGHLKLGWDDACLSPQDNKRRVATASNAQVRQKVYQGSSEKWKRYRPYLNGALDHLSAAHK